MSLIKFKRSAVSGKIPLSSDLDTGELALNYADGALYYKKTDGTIGTISGGGGGGLRTIYEETANTVKTTITIAGGYTPGYIDVWYNGIQLGSSDFTATDGTTVVLAQATTVGDFIRTIAYSTVSLADTYRKAEVDALITSGAIDTAIIMAIALG
jgi:hypothetical protein